MKKLICLFVMGMLLSGFVNAFAKDAAEEAMNKGVDYSFEGKYDKAIAEFNKAIAINPNLAEAYGERGSAYKHKGDYDRAISDQTKVIKIDPRSDVAYYNRGNAYAKKGNLDQAISDYTKSIEINPKEYKVYLNRGNYYFKKGKLDQAISDYTKAIEINSYEGLIYYNRGFAYFAKKDYGKCWADVNKAEKLGLHISSDFVKQLEEATGAIGIVMNESGGDKSVISIIKVASNSPAALAGIRIGDILVSVDNQKVNKKADASSLLLGLPKTQVSVTVMRGNESINLNLTRALFTDIFGH